MCSQDQIDQVFRSYLIAASAKKDEETHFHLIKMVEMFTSNGDERAADYQNLADELKG